MTFILDTDSHFMPKDCFDDVDPRFEHHAPHFVYDAIGRSMVVYPEREAALSPQQKQWRSFNNWLMRAPGTLEPDVRLEFMDANGIDLQVLVPSEQFHYDIEPDLGTAVCQSHNNAMGRLLQKYPGRFIALANVPMQSPPRAVKELERAVNELGLHAALIFGNIDGRNLDEPAFWPVYETLERLDKPLIIHPGRFGKLIGIERGYKFHMENSLGFLYEGTFAIASLITGGVLDKFPRLRVGFLETGAGYLPTLMDRLNEVYETEGVDKLILKRPDEYLDQLWLSVNVSSERRTLPYLVQRHGADCFMMGSDYPHGLGGANLDDLRNNSELSEDAKERILGLNAAKLFGILVPALERPHAAAATV
jgi:predicted TIM-barrel fold metal-dependent hydrolase